MTTKKKRYEDLFNPPTQEDEAKLAAALAIIGTLVDALLTERQQAVLFERYPRMRNDLADIAHASRSRTAHVEACATDAPSKTLAPPSGPMAEE